MGNILKRGMEEIDITKFDSDENPTLEVENCGNYVGIELMPEDTCNIMKGLIPYIKDVNDALELIALMATKGQELTNGK